MLNPIELQRFIERTKAMVEKAKKLQGDNYNDKFFVVDLKEKKANENCSTKCLSMGNNHLCCLGRGLSKGHSGGILQGCKQGYIS